MYDLYQKKYQYERLIKSLNENYNRLNNAYYNLSSYKNKIIKTLKIDDDFFSFNELNTILKNINDSKNMIINKLIPQAKYQYNIILSQIYKG